MTGAAGNDTLTGGDGADIFIYDGKGKDVVTDYTAGEDTLKLTSGTVGTYSISGSDATFKVGSGSVKVSGGKNKAITVVDSKNKTYTYDGGLIYEGDVAKAKAVSVTAAYGNTLASYGASVVTIDSSARTKALNIVGNAAANKITGTSANDTIDGGAGNDTLTGGKGKDLFIYESGSGNDLVYDYAAGQDTIKISGGEVSDYSLSGSDAVLKVGSGSLKVKGGKSAAVLVVDDNKKVSLYQGGAIYNAASATKATAATLTSAYGNSFTAGTSMISVDASERKNTINIVGSAKNNFLVGGAGKDIIDGGKGNDSISGGKGSDILTGGAGSDVFIYANGDGTDAITDYVSGEDVIKLTSGAVKSYSVKNGDAILKVGSGAITLKGAGNNAVSVLDADDVLTVYNGGLIYNNPKISRADVVTITADYDGEFNSYGASVETIDAAARTKAIEITGNGADNFILGGKGKDTIDAGKGNDTIYAGKGNDLLTGGKGADVFFYATGDGNDTITDYGTGSDIISVNGSVSYSTKNGDAVLKIGSGNVTLKDAEEVAVTVVGEDSVASIYSGSNVSTKTWTGISSSSGGETVTVTETVEVEVTLPPVTETVEVEVTLPAETVTVAGETVTETVEVEVTLPAETVTVEAEPVTITVGGGEVVTVTTTETVEVEVTLPAETITVEAEPVTITVGGGEVVTVEVTLPAVTLPAETVTVGGGEAVTVTVGGGGSIIAGTSGADTLYGTAGNDTITFGGGKDIYVYSGGNDYDIITDYKEGDDRISLDGASFNGGLVVGNDILLEIGGGILRLKNAKYSKVTLVIGGIETEYVNAIKSGTGADGVTVTLEADRTDAFSLSAYNSTVDKKAGNIDASPVKNSIAIYGDEENNIILAGQSGTGIYAGLGNDIIHGGDGNDTIYYWSNDGNDTIYNYKTGDEIRMRRVDEDDITTFKNFSVSGNDVIINFTNNSTITLKEAGDQTIALGEWAYNTSNWSYYWWSASNSYNGTFGYVTISGGTATLNKKYQGNCATNYYANVTNIDASNVTVSTNLYGDSKANVIYAGKSGGSIYGGAGNDTIYCGAGVDSIVYESGGGNDTVCSIGAGDYVSLKDCTVEKISVSGTDVVISIEDSSNKITFKDATGKRIWITRQNWQTYTASNGNAAVPWFAEDDTNFTTTDDLDSLIETSIANSAGALSVSGGDSLSAYDFTLAYTDDK